MKRTPLKRYTPLKAKRGLNGKSPTKIRELQAEAPIRIALCQRAGGTPLQEQKTVTISGKEYTYTKVTCAGGRCEYCHKPADSLNPLEPHEQVFRSHGGQLSLENSLMVHRFHCHETLQNNRPIGSNHNAERLVW